MWQLRVHGLAGVGFLVATWCWPVVVQRVGRIAVLWCLVLVELWFPHSKLFYYLLESSFSSNPQDNSILKG